MPAIQFERRVLIDYDFFVEVVKPNTDKPRLLLKLMYINSKSKNYKRHHICMSKNIFDKILGEFGIPRDLLRSSLNDLDSPIEIEEIEDEIERNIKHAIEIAFQSKIPMVILTTEEKQKKYEENSHYQGVKNISVKSGEESLIILNGYFEECTAK